MTKDGIAYPKVFDVERVSYSESALLLFTQVTQGKSFVLKVLKPIKDDRYDQLTLRARQGCLLEALEWNRKFNPLGIYIGIARVPDVDVENIVIRDWKQIRIDSLLTEPVPVEELDAKCDYALIMMRLPDERRLDVLLRMQEEKDFLNNMHKLLKYIVQVHKRIKGYSSDIHKNHYWGSVEQLEEKLDHNIALLEKIAEINPEPTYRLYLCLKATLKDTIHLPKYIQYFKYQVQQHQILRCHGDLKCSNIWISDHVYLLDAIDFNEAYCNIDILSDIAMLIADIQARLFCFLYFSKVPLVSYEEALQRSTTLGKTLIEMYLDITGQQSEMTNDILAYYLLEKCLVGAAVSIVHDDAPRLGLSYFQIAKLYQEQLKSK